MDKKFFVIGFGNIGLRVAQLLVSKDVKSARIGDTSGIYEVLNLAEVVKIRLDDLRGDKKRRLCDVCQETPEILERLGDTTTEEIAKYCEGRIAISALPTSPKFEEGATAHINYTAAKNAEMCVAVDKSYVYPEAYVKLREFIENKKFVPIGSILAPCEVWDLVDGADIAGGRGIVNGTSNYVCWRMEDGLDFESALDEAKNKGYADPHAAGLGFGDLVGLDSAVKMMVLVRLRNPKNSGRIPVSLRIGDKEYLVEGGERFFDKDSREEVRGEEIYNAVKKELERIPELMEQKKTLRQIAMTGDNGVVVELKVVEYEEYSDMEKTLNRLEIDAEFTEEIDENGLLEIYDKVNVKDDLYECELERLGVVWGIMVVRTSKGILVQGPGAGAIETANSLVDACMRRM